MKKTASLAVLAGILFAALLATVGCRPCGSSGGSAPATDLPRPAAGEFTVMTFNLHQYALAAPGGAADSLAAKPSEETAAIVEAIRQVAPDILAVQEMGDPRAWDNFKLRLREAGLDYFNYEEYLRQDPADLNLALLSRFPIANRMAHTDDAYTIGPTRFPVRRGFIEVDLEVVPAYRLHLIVAHLKSKLFHEYGQAEMRRNEARLLNNHVRAALKDDPDLNLLVLGDPNDDPSSRPLREILFYQDHPLLHDLRPTDEHGAAWTHRDSDDSHQRLDYLLVSDGLLPEVVLDKTLALNFLSLAKASDHRPLPGIFAASERPPESAPDLSSRQSIDIPMDD